MRQLAVAILVALLVGVVSLLAPVDWTLWVAQVHVNPQAASGRIVFASAQRDMAAPNSPASRIELATAIRNLDMMGARHVYLNLLLDRPSEPGADQMLATAIARMGRRMTLVEGPDPANPSGSQLAVNRTIPLIAGSTAVVIAERHISFFGYTWTSRYGYRNGTGYLNALPSALAGRAPGSTDSYAIDYSFNLDSIPRVDLYDLAAATPGSPSAAALLSEIRGKTVLIGRGDPQAAAFTNIPRNLLAPTSYVYLYAAETLLHGEGGMVPWSFPVAVIAICLALGSRGAPNSRWRRCAHLLAAATPVIAFVLAGQRHLQITLSPSLAALATFAFLRWWANRRAAIAMFDDLTGLPSFRALRHDLDDADLRTRAGIVVARILNFDDVLSSLPEHLHVQYALAIADRLRVTDPHLKVYKASTGLYAWTATDQPGAMLDDHLMGLRAIFAQPLMIGGRAIDVAITFGVDNTDEADPATRVSSASAAAQKATQAEEPVRYSTVQLATTRQWEVSLHAALDAAMENGDIYTVYQPQFCIGTGKLLGAEALVRWHDAVRGDISPAYFVEQCEQAGRIAALTQFVIGQAVAASGAIAAARQPITMSINISATLLGDMIVPDLLGSALAKCNQDAANIILEITETARIADFAKAGRVLGMLREMGARISADDFGVDSGNLLNLLRLPYDEIKIDRAFICRMRSDAKARHIVDALIHLGKSASLSVVAEGIEDIETLAVLRSMGCGIGQGFHLGRPMRLESFLAFQSIEGSWTATGD